MRSGGGEGMAGAGSGWALRVGVEVPPGCLGGPASKTNRNGNFGVCRIAGGPHPEKQQHLSKEPCLALHLATQKQQTAQNASAEGPSPPPPLPLQPETERADPELPRPGQGGLAAEPSAPPSRPGVSLVPVCEPCVSAHVPALA